MIQTNGKKIFEAVGADAVFTTCDYLRDTSPVFSRRAASSSRQRRHHHVHGRPLYRGGGKGLAGTEVRVAEMDRFANTPTELLKKYKTVGIPFELTFYPEYKKLSELGISLVDSMPAFRKCMAVKNESELAAIAKACDIAEEGFLKLLPEIREGMTESEVAALLEYNMRKLGAYSVSFDTIVAFGPHAAVPHHETGSTKLKFGDEILVDFGCKVDGYLFRHHPHLPFRGRQRTRGIQKGLQGRSHRARIGKGKARFGHDGRRSGRDREKLSRRKGIRKVFHAFSGTRHRLKHSRVPFREKGRDGRPRGRHGVFGRAGRLSCGRIRRAHRGYHRVKRRKSRELYAQNGQKSCDFVSVPKTADACGARGKIKQEKIIS